MKLKVARMIAKIIASRAIDRELKTKPFHSSCKECNELVMNELTKLSNKLIGEYDGSFDPNDLLEALGEKDKLESAKNQSKLF